MTPERTEKIMRVLDHRQNDLTVVLENVFDPHNISAVMRSCESVGVQELYVLNNRLPPHKKWGARSSSSAAKWLTIHQFTNAEECFGVIRQKYKRVLATHLAESATSLYDLDLTQSVALVFGNEHSGVSEEILTFTDGNFIIPQMGIIRSLNISVACAVSLYEAFRQKAAAGHYQNRKLDEETASLLIKKWELNLDAD
jgi:tRNA (guanosine-2'-O-)-methyltransferase